MFGKLGPEGDPSIGKQESGWWMSRWRVRWFNSYPHPLVLLIMGIDYRDFLFRSSMGFTLLLVVVLEIGIL